MPTQGPFQFVNSTNAAVTDLHVVFRNTGGNLTNPAMTQGPLAQPVANQNVVDVFYAAPLPPGTISGFRVDCVAPGVEVDSAFWTIANQPAGAAQPFDISAAVDQAIADIGTWAKQLRGQQTAFVGDVAQKAVEVAFASATAQQILAWTIKAAQAEGIADTVVQAVWQNLRNQTAQAASAGTAFDSSFDHGLACWQFSEANLGQLIPVAAPPMLIADHDGAPLILADTSGGVVDPKSKAGKAVLIIDLILEIIGALLLLANVALPAIKWQRLVDLVAETGIDGLDTVTKLIGILYQNILDGEPMEKILKVAIDILKWAWGSESAWGVIKGALDLSFWDWVELIAKFILITAIEAGGDSVSAGAVSAAKIGLVIAALGDIVLKKIPKLTGEENPHMKSSAV